MSPSPPKNSATIATSASGAGMYIVPVNRAIVAEKPKPPNHPSIFCAPWAKKTTLSTSRSIVVAVLLSVAHIVRIMTSSWVVIGALAHHNGLHSLFSRRASPCRR